MRICVEESFDGYDMLMCSFMLLNSKGREESVTLAKPHLPLTAITKTSPEAQAAPPEPAAKSAEQPAKCSEQKAETHSLCELRVSIDMFKKQQKKNLVQLISFFPRQWWSPASSPCHGRVKHTESRCSKPANCETSSRWCRGKPFHRRSV